MASQTLNTISMGQHATILEVEGKGPFRRRLLEMGLTPGQDLEVLRIAPMGDPMQLRIRGGQLSIRRNEAKNIVVKPGQKQPVLGLKMALFAPSRSTA